MIGKHSAPHTQHTHTHRHSHPSINKSNSPQITEQSLMLSLALTQSNTAL